MRDVAPPLSQGPANMVDDAPLCGCAPAFPPTSAGELPRWVVVDVEEVDIHCRKHTPHRIPTAREQRECGTDNVRAKGGDFFHAMAESRVLVDSPTAGVTRRRSAARHRACTPGVSGS